MRTTPNGGGYMGDGLLTLRYNETSISESNYN